MKKTTLKVCKTYEISPRIHGTFKGIDKTGNLFFDIPGDMFIKSSGGEFNGFVGFPRGFEETFEEVAP